MEMVKIVVSRKSKARSPVDN